MLPGEDDVAHDWPIIVVVQTNVTAQNPVLGVSRVNVNFLLVADVQVVYLVPSEKLYLLAGDRVYLLHDDAFLQVLGRIQLKKLL